VDEGGAADGTEFYPSVKPGRWTEARPRTERVSRLVIAEVKQSRHTDHLGAIPALRAVHARAEALSKYCLGTILLVPVRANVFKPALRAVERLSV
jgi:hypothetical protein